MNGEHSARSGTSRKPRSGESQGRDEQRRFVDTNILVYLFDMDAPEKKATVAGLFEREGASGLLVVSTQVLQEFYVVVTRKLARPLAPEIAEQAVRDFATLPVRQVTPALVLSAIRRSIESRLSFWDALIVETASDAGATVLLTEDLQHGQVIDGIRVVNPFASVGAFE
ncbi:MAG: PIN domain-containing protein [Gammaproteobacteria bacterium]